MKVTEELLKQIGFKQSNKKTSSYYGWWILIVGSRTIQIRLNSSGKSFEYMYRNEYVSELKTFQELLAAVAQDFYLKGCSEQKTKIKQALGL